MSLLCAQPQPRRKLTEGGAVLIFAMRGTLRPGILGNLLGVSPKTVRDIWTARSWRKETAFLDPDRPPMPHKPMGRPKGSKDLRPRRYKCMQLLLLPLGCDKEESLDDELHAWKESIWFDPRRPDAV